MFDVRLGFRGRSAETLILSPGVTVEAAQTAGSTAKGDSASSTAWTRGIARVGEVAAPTKVQDVAPVYPPIALSARVQGVVFIEARVEPDGRVSHARVVQSIPLVDEAALDSVMQWVFSPTLLNGKPIPVLVTLELKFAPLF